MPEVRIAIADDLNSLLELYRASEFSESAQPELMILKIWSAVLEHDGTNVFVAMFEKKVTASCTLITAPNLFRGGQSHGFLENVATLPEFRARGHGSAVIQAALTAAWDTGCFHVMMQSGRKDPRVHEFYRQQGFEPNLRTAYLARRPSD